MSTRFIESIHQRYVYSRRVDILAKHLAGALPTDAHVLDVGAGDGNIAARIASMRPDLRFTGVDVLVRPRTEIPVIKFDGHCLPFSDDAFDAVMFVDVLHHTEDPLVLLREAARVARQSIVIKDHTLEGLLAGPTLRFMDWVGNARHGVALPYNYWPRNRWFKAIEEIRGTLDLWNARLRLYQPPLNLFFERRLHFLARIGVSTDNTASTNCK